MPQKLDVTHVFAMKKQGKVSIVLPIYNVEQYLAKCLDSIIIQTYSNIEILLVDDGSTDKCSKICDEYKARDSRIKTFHLSNGGVAKARQYGVENSVGEFIVFVDPDDWLPLDAIDVLYSNMSDDIDLVIGAAVVYLGEKKRYVNYKPTYSPTFEHFGDSCTRVISQDEYLRALISWEVRVAPWAKLYRRCLFTKDSFPNFKRTQDLLMNVEIATRMRKIKYVDKIVYNYLGRSLLSKPLTFNSTFEYEKTFCNTLKAIIEKNVDFNDYAVEHSKCVLSVVNRTILAGSQIDFNDPLIKQTKFTLKDISLSPDYKRKLKALNSKVFCRYVYCEYNLRCWCSYYLKLIKHKLISLKKAVNCG